MIVTENDLNQTPLPNPRGSFETLCVKPAIFLSFAGFSNFPLVTANRGRSAISQETITRWRRRESPLYDPNSKFLFHDAN
jgi:hypothetical protein